jgi:hypothetical protein
MPYVIQLLGGSWIGRLPTAVAAIAIPLTQHAVVIVGAMPAGALTPPLEPCLRTLWPDIVSGDQLEGEAEVRSAGAAPGTPAA